MSTACSPTASGRSATGCGRLPPTTCCHTSKGGFERGEFPVELARGYGDLGILGMHLDGYGCAGASAVEYGVANRELEYGDSGLRSFVSVQGSLATSIRTYGSDAQREEWLPRMARGDAIGCFALTEPGPVPTRRA